jgi:PAS domain S-box-containing protein
MPEIRTILLVEDNPGDARLLVEMLKEESTNVIAQTNARSMSEAESVLQAQATDIILLDLGLPDANGLEAVRRIRLAAPRVPLVVLTGLDDVAIATSALQQGAQDYLIKGQTDARGLLRALRYAVGRKTMEDALFDEKELAQVTLNCIGDAVACTDFAGKLTYLNQNAQRLTGWSLREALGRSMAEVFHITDAYHRDAISNTMARALGRDGIAHLPADSVLVRRDGREIPVEDSVAPIHDRDGNPTGAVIVVRDVSASRGMAVRMAAASSDLARQNSLLNRVNDELAGIIRSSPIAVYATDPSGVVTMWSPAAERLSGFSHQEAMGVFLPLVPAASVEEFRNRVRRVSEGEHESNVELLGRKKDGAMIELSISRGAIALAENVTEAVAERKKMSRMQSDFVSTVSHELRTPLTSIGGSLGLIVGGAAGTINDRATRLVEIASSNTQRLIRLVDDILDIEKLQSGHMVFRFSETNLDDVVEQAVAANQAFAAKFGIELHRIGPTCNVLVRADVDRVNQAITNLLSNAAKFSPAGSRVDISTTRTHQGVRVSVSDSGPGIPQEFRGRIFERFAQADTSDMREKGGSGLGLSIVRRIMDRHGGQVSFDSNPDIGTSFHLDFHVIPSEGAESSPDRIAPQESRVLVCALEPELADPICSTLLAHGFNCLSVLSEEQAALEAGKGAVKAAIIELPFAMKRVGSFVAKLRERVRDDGLPVIVVCADPSARRNFSVALARPLLPWTLRLTALERPIRQVAHGGDPRQTEKPAILHVENDQAAVEAVREALQNEFEVVAAATLEIARQFLARDRFVLIIIDFKLSADLVKDVIPAIGGTDDSVMPIVLLTLRDHAADATQGEATVPVGDADVAMLIEAVRSTLAAPARSIQHWGEAGSEAQSALRRR